MRDALNSGLIDFLKASPTPFHATASLAQRLEAAGYQRLDERDSWATVPGGRYYVTRNDSSIIAIKLGKQAPLLNGIRMVGAHTDSPCLRVKPQPELQRQGVRIRMIGDRNRFSEKVQHYLARAEEQTAQGQTLTLILALNYSSRSEITRAVQHLAREAAEGRLQADAITEQTIAGALDTAAYPDPDLIVRTSGEQRLSNFLLWQASYAELWFPEVLWPDFTEADFDRAMEEYARRDRRFGLVK